MGVTLINPFSGSTIGLPPIIDLSEFEYLDSEKDDFEYIVFKATLSADPALSPDDYIVTAIYGDTRQLAFIQPGDQAWTYIDDKQQRSSVFFEVIYYKGQNFAVDYWGRVVMIDVNSRDGVSKAPQVKVIAPRTKVHSDRIYLLESSSGDFLIVKRFLSEIGDNLQHETSRFKVIKLLLQPNEKDEPKRIEVKSLGGDAMFLGDSHSTCISASKFPGCQPNSIYYTDDYGDIERPYGRRDIGIFNVENGSFGTHYILDPSQKDMPPAFWIVPSVLGY